MGEKGIFIPKHENLEKETMRLPLYEKKVQ